MIRFTDVHQHFLYGIDDGAQSPKIMQKMLDRANSEKIERIIATPHVSPGMTPYKREQVLHTLEEASRYCDDMGYGMELHEGAEILYTESTARMLGDGDIPTMADTRYVLVEFPTDVSYSRLYDAACKLLSYGYLPVIAHVERYRCLTHHLSNAYKLKEELDVCYQMNCSTIANGGRFLEGRFINSILQNEQIDIAGTDAHNITSRPACMRAAYAALKESCGVRYARKLMQGRLIFGEIE